jgi:hypothetical protein
VDIAARGEFSTRKNVLSRPENGISNDDGSVAYKTAENATSWNTRQLESDESTDKKPNFGNKVRPVQWKNSSRAAVPCNAQWPLFDDAMAKHDFVLLMEHATEQLSAQLQLNFFSYGAARCYYGPK